MRRVWFLGVFWLVMAPIVASASETLPVPASGPAGSVEVFVFTDYFCPPCRAVEPYLDEALERLHHLGTTIAFVDMPIHAQTTLFSRYYLYATHAGNRLEEQLRVRRVLFDLAEKQAVGSEVEMIRALREQQIPLSLVDTRPIFADWAALIRRFGVRSTPTLVVVRPGQEPLSLSGRKAIVEGIDGLLADLSAPAGKKE